MSDSWNDQPGWTPGQGGFQQPRPGGSPPQPGQYDAPSDQPYPPPNPQYPQYPAPPGQPYQQPPGHYVGTPVPRKRRKWPWIVGGIFLFFVLAIGGCSFLIFNLARAPIDGGNEWIAMLDEGDFAGAQASMCSTSALDIGMLEADFGAGIDDYDLNGYNSTSGATTVDGTITVGGATRAITLFMNDEDDAWRVCNYLLL